MSKQEVTKNYFMATGHVFFHEKDSEEVQSTFENAVIASENAYLNTIDLGRAQQAMQVQLHNKVQGIEIIVVDVKFATIFPLGAMTQTQFLNIPETTTVQ